LFFHLF